MGPEPSFASTAAGSLRPWRGLNRTGAVRTVPQRYFNFVCLTIDLFFFWWLRKKYRKRCKFLNFDAWVCDCYSFFQKKWKIFSPVGAHGVLGSVGWIFWETKREPEVLKLKVSLFRNQIYIKNKDKNENSVFFAFPQVFLMDRWSLIDGSYFQVVVLIEPSGWIFLRVIMPLGCIFW